MRLDSYLFAKGICESRNKASNAITRGEISVNGKTVYKNSFSVYEGDDVKRTACETFVSEGGFKLDKALRDFGFDVSGLTAVDVGASTGGFTDVLLKRGAKKVYAVDLNDELLHKTLKEDERVYAIIKNAKDLIKEDFKDEIDLFTADLSFISETVILPVLKKIVKKDGYLIILIKPQFETGERRKYKNGIIKDEKVVENAVKKVLESAKKCGLSPLNITSAPEREDKNREFLALLFNGEKTSFDFSLFSLNKNPKKI